MTQNATRYQEQKEARIAWAIEHMSIDTIGDATFATTPSTSGKQTVYTVDIDESGDTPCAVKCDCPATCVECVHYQAVCRFFQRIHSLMHPPVVEEVVSVGEAMTQAVETMVEYIDAAAVAGDKSYDEAVVAALNPGESINPRTGMTDTAYQQYQNYLMGIGAL